MRNLEILVEKQDVINYVNNLWITEEFKKSSAEEAGIIYQITRDFAKYPRVFFQYTDPKKEKFHFSSMYNSIPHRKYENQAIQDLFYLHEIYHLVTRSYIADVSFSKWVSRFYENETEASLMTEVLIYFYFPELRKKTFEHEIWADRLLDEKISLSKLLTQDEIHFGSHYPKSNHNFFQNHKEDFIIFLTRLRLSILINPLAVTDDIEKGINRWLGRNFEYFKCWRDDFLEVEKTMVTFQRMSETNRNEAAKFLIDWLKNKKIDVIFPFQNVAESFNEKINKQT